MRNRVMTAGNTTCRVVPLSALPHVGEVRSGGEGVEIDSGTGVAIAVAGISPGVMAAITIDTGS